MSEAKGADYLRSLQTSADMAESARRQRAIEDREKRKLDLGKRVEENYKSMMYSATLVHVLAERRLQHVLIEKDLQAGELLETLVDAFVKRLEHEGFTVEKIDRKGTTVLCDDYPEPHRRALMTVVHVKW